MQTIFALVLSFLVLLTAFSILIPNPPVHAESVADSWPMYQHEPSHIGYTDDAAPTAPTQLWNFTLEIDPGSLPGSPAVANGYVYVSSAENIYCFDASTGAKVWSFPTGNFAGSTPAVTNGRVYAGSIDGNFYSIAANSGAQIWSYNIRTQGQPEDSADSSPTVDGDRVYFESWKGDIYCLETASGNKVWNFSTGADAQDSSLAVDGGYVYAGNSEGNVFGLDASNGARIWNYSTGGAVHSAAVSNGFVYFGSADGNAYCLRASDGAKIWNYTTEYNSNGPSHNYHWGNTVSNPAVAYGHVFVGSSDFLIFCLDASSGDQVWNYTTNAEVYSAPAVAGGAVLAGSYDGNLYCLKASAGSQIWSYPAGVFSPVNAGGSAGSSAIADGIVYLVGNGVLYALGSQETTAAPTFPFALVLAVVVVVAIAVVLTVVLLKRKSSNH